MTRPSVNLYTFEDAQVLTTLIAFLRVYGQAMATQPRAFGLRSTYERNALHLELFAVVVPTKCLVL